MHLSKGKRAVIRKEKVLGQSEKGQLSEVKMELLAPEKGHSTGRDEKRHL